jgi:hypothetical protein
MYESLPLTLRNWVAGQAERMGLPEPDSYILLLIRLEKQNQDLAVIHQHITENPEIMPAKAALTN